MSEYCRKYLADILDSIQFISDCMGTVTFLEYKTNRLLKSAVERHFEIIGEALNQALKIDPTLPLTNKQQIVGMRNRIIHAYDAVDDLMIYDAALRHLTTLKTEIEQLI